MSRLDRSKLNPNFVKSKRNADASVEMFSPDVNGFSDGQLGEAKSIPQAILKRAATTGNLIFSNKGLTSVPPEIFNLDESIVRDENTKWWEFTDIVTVDLSSNQIAELPPQISNLMALKKLDIHDNCLTFLPHELGQLQNLNRVDLSRNKICKPLPDTFGSLRALVQLNANNNKLPSFGLNDEMPPNVGQLDLSFNDLKEVDRNFALMKKLQDLNLSQNKIVKIAAELSLCTNLQDLDLSYNQLSEVPTELGSLPELLRLNLNNNRLTTFPKFTATKKLRELLLNSNKIESMPEENIEPLSGSLEILLVADNQIKSLPANFDTLEQLASLDVSCNNLSTLPDRLGLLKNLKNLKVDGNPMRSIRQDVLRGGPGAVLKFLRNRLPLDQIDSNKATIEERFITDSKILDYSKRGATEVPDNILIDAEVKRVQGINLEQNKFSNLSVGFTMLKHSVVELNLASNLFTVLPEVIPHFYNLQSLKLFNNRLTDLPETMINLTSLIELNVSGNQLSQVPPIIYSLKSLQSLSLADNRITDVDPVALKAMTKLDTLDLQNNYIKRVPPELGLCEQLKTLLLVGNPFKRPTFAELNKGTVFVMEKLRNQIVT